MIALQDGDAAAVTRLACTNFSAMVLMPSTIELQIHAVASEQLPAQGGAPPQCTTVLQTVHFSVLNGEGQVAIRGGVVQLRLTGDSRGRL